MINDGHIFISYKTEQRDLAIMVRDKLQEWGYETWLDVDRLKPGTYWANDIDRALKTCIACIGIMTPLSTRSRYVTNEWDMTIMKGKLFIPLMFEETDPHYKYIDIQYVDFSTPNRIASFEQLRLRLTEQSHTPQIAVAQDPYLDYLHELYNRINKFLSVKLLTSLRDSEGRPQPIELEVEETDGAVDALFERREEIDPLFEAGGIIDDLSHTFNGFFDAVEYFDGRILLLGEPGSGKTIALLHYARDAVIKRKQSSTQPLPILGIIPTWDPELNPSMDDWLASSFGAPANTQELIARGDALLILDGLDELGNERQDSLTGKKFDPRERFIETIPSNNKVVVSCRAEDYNQLSTRAKLNGAITLQPLDTEQKLAYLHSESGLIQVIKSNSQINSWLNTPLILSLFGFAFGENPELLTELIDLSETEFRERIFDYYVDHRFQHERRKQNFVSSYSLDDVYSVLGRIAIDNASSWFAESNIIDAKIMYGTMRSKEIIGLSVKLGFLILRENETYSFSHLMLRDYFATKYGLPLLEDPTNLKDYRSKIAIALAAIQETRALKLMVPLINHEDPTIRAQIAIALKSFGESAETLFIQIVADKSQDLYVRCRIAEFLGDSTERVIPILDSVINDPNVPKLLAKTAEESRQKLLKRSNKNSTKT